MAIDLVVRSAFGPYKVGTRISDPATIAEIKASPAVGFVIQIDHDAASPSMPDVVAAPILETDGLRLNRNGVDRFLPASDYEAFLLTAGRAIPQLINGLSVSKIAGLQAALEGKATPADLAAQRASLLNGADAAHDTLGEIQTLLQADDSTLAGLLTAVGARLVAASNLSDLADKAAARGNLGLGSVANLAPSDLPISNAVAAALAGKATPADLAALRTSLLNGADAAHDTLGEIQALLQADEGTLAGLLTSVAARLISANNLSDLTDVTAARANLGALGRAFLAKAGAPTTAEITAGAVRFVKDTGTGRISIWANDGGTLVDLLSLTTA